MQNVNRVFIATSLDGYIADLQGGIDWLHAIPNPEGIDVGYGELMAKTDALVMGRNTFETVCGFDMDWPYSKPVFVLSNSLTEIPIPYQDKAFLVKGTLSEVLSEVHQQGYYQLYIDGGKTIQSFLREDLIDEMIITTIPVLLGEGIPLFGSLPKRLNLRCTKSLHFLNAISQSHYERVRK